MPATVQWIYSGLTELDSFGFPSRLKPDEPFTVKIGDFGLARFLDDPDDLTAGVGTEGYMAPEVRIGEAYGTDGDLYSLGVMLKKDLERIIPPEWVC